MSADNYIAVQQQADGQWAVWHESASNDYPRPRRASNWPTKPEAMAYACGLERGLIVVEYGVCELAPLKYADPRIPLEQLRGFQNVGTRFFGRFLKVLPRLTPTDLQLIRQFRALLNWADRHC